MFKSVFLSHPRSVGETYLEHQGVALSFAGELMVAGLACAVHAFIPALFSRAASQKIERLYLRLNVKRHAKSPNRAHSETSAV